MDTPAQHTLELRFINVANSGQSIDHYKPNDGVHFTLEPWTSGRVLAPVPILWATHNRGNHGGIAPTQIGNQGNHNW